MIGEGYWATGITLLRLDDRDRWGASLEFFDRIISTEGTMHTRYFIPGGAAGALAATRVLIADAERLGITFRSPAPDGQPSLYLHRDNWLTPTSEIGDADCVTVLDHVAREVGWRVAARPESTEADHGQG